MKVTPINSAEAIFEAFFDETLSQLPRWQIAGGGAEGLYIQQKWAWVQYDWQRAPEDPAVPALRMSRSYDFDCADYDAIMLSLTTPPGARVALIAQTDAGERKNISAPMGHKKRELLLPLDGAKRVLGLAIEIYADRRDTPGVACGWFNWLGLQHAEQLKRYQRQLARFDERWEDYLKPESYEPNFEPAYGLHLTGAELTEARAALAKTGGPRSSPLWELAEDAAALSPEKMTTEYVNFWNDTRFNRDRDTGNHLLTHGANAAQAAVLFRDKKLGRLAARYAIAMAHCTRWDPSFLSWMAGCKWEHRAFVPSLVMYDCALILDLCGEWFTDYGRQLILRRLAEEGQGTNNYNAWWYTYIFWCNQAAWFMPGRMLAYLVLEKTLPTTWEPYPKPQSRVIPYTDLALTDLLDNLAKILLPDGGYTEGPMYFTFTARQAMLTFYYYARARGKDIRPMVPPALYATARMAEVLVSTADNAQMIQICDAIYIPQEGAAFLAWVMPDTQWVTIFRKSVARTGGQPMTLLAQNLLREVPESGPVLPPVADMPDIGQMASHRKFGAEWVKLFLMGNKSGASHTHEDKGSFVLEFAGDAFAWDFGSCDYSNPLADMLKHAQRHNMLVPLTAGVRAKPKNPIFADITPKGRGDERSFHATMDLAAGWEGLYSRWTRTWDAPTPDTLTITDDWAIEQGDGVAFCWTTPLPITLDAANRRAVIEGRRGRAILTWDAGIEAAVEALPLEQPAWKEVLKERKEMFLVATLLGETQPRLTLTQRGRSGRLTVRVKLEHK
ncbi:MAG: heparinase II/III family protein [Verrucomicrobia bacterium]|nr:heparinase II/III family protein [Verrucomicrobiota bacterium]